jgi:hypothetical protein
MWPLLEKRNPTFIQLEVDGKHLIEPCNVTDEFSKNFQSVYNKPRPVFPTASSSSEFLSFALLSDSDILETIKCIRCLEFNYVN